MDTTAEPWESIGGKHSLFWTAFALFPIGMRFTWWTQKVVYYAFDSAHKVYTDGDSKRDYFALETPVALLWYPSGYLFQSIQLIPATVAQNVM